MWNRQEWLSDWHASWGEVRVLLQLFTLAERQTSRVQGKSSSGKGFRIIIWVNCEGKLDLRILLQRSSNHCEKAIWRHYFHSVKGKRRQAFQQYCFFSANILLRLCIRFFPSSFLDATGTGTTLYSLHSINAHVTQHFSQQWAFVETGYDAPRLMKTTTK